MEKKSYATRSIRIQGTRELCLYFDLQLFLTYTYACFLY